jgi:hypothetical protein
MANFEKTVTAHIPDNIKTYIIDFTQELVNSQKYYNEMNYEKDLCNYSLPFLVLLKSCDFHCGNSDASKFNTLKKMHKIIYDFSEVIRKISPPKKKVTFSTSNPAQSTNMFSVNALKEKVPEKKLYTGSDFAANKSKVPEWMESFTFGKKQKLVRLKFCVKIGDEHPIYYRESYNAESFTYETLLQMIQEIPECSKYKVSISYIDDDNTKVEVKSQKHFYELLRISYELTRQTNPLSKDVKVVLNIDCEPNIVSNYFPHFKKC